MTQVPTQSKQSPNLLMPSGRSCLSALDELNGLVVPPIVSLVSQDGGSPEKEEPLTLVPVKTQPP